MSPSKDSASQDLSTWKFHSDASLERLHSVSIIIRCVMSPSDAVDLESPLIKVLLTFSEDLGLPCYGYHT